ncbi:hypothetical protein [Chryseosolibacter indicus]|uniref:Uncharacterized protein n=1 Tax=Chryseosolibacter indicus TaxID=2782351 RepID=A0ABS5VVI8_9BACT|nr:hypothetical protein [Chryseosolibacter indicus]MBT1704011.1 hypothetical protein [Chryseosolibacter indicus]
MAILSSEITFTGSIGQLSAYKMRGSDKIIIRKKGGASKEKIKHDAAFANTRRVNAEFGGRATASKWIMKMLSRVKPLADYNVAGSLNSLLKPIQMGSEGVYGKRGIELSQKPHLLEGFSLNRITPIESVIRTPIVCSVSRENLSARIEIPALVPDINFQVHQRHPMYKIIAVLGIVPDLFHQEWGYSPSDRAYDNIYPEITATEWMPSLKESAPTVLELAYSGTQLPDNKFSIMLSVGICYGKMTDTNTIEQVKHAGSAKIFSVR